MRLSDGVIMKGQSKGISHDHVQHTDECSKRIHESPYLGYNPKWMVVHRRW